MSINQENKILFVDDQVYKLFENKNESTGGAAIQTKNWMIGFEKLGYVVKFTSKKKSSEASLVCKYLDKNPKYFFWIFYLFDYCKVVKSFNPSIIYLSTAGWKTFLWAIVAKVVGAKYIQRISNNIVFKDSIYKKRLGKFKYFLSKLGVKNADLILCQNLEQEQNIKECFPGQKVKILYNPYMINQKKRNHFNDRAYIAWVGLYQYQKNLPALLKIVKSCKEINFKIAGTEARYMDKDTVLALKELNKCKNVEFVGFLNREEIKVFLSKSYCLLNTSHYEGFSNTYLEAFAMGTPVITRKITDPDGIIQRNDLGHVAEDFDEIIPLIRQISNNGHNNSGKIISYIQENHNPEILADQIVKCLNELK